MKRRDIGWAIVCMALLVMYIRMGFILKVENQASKAALEARSYNVQMAMEYVETLEIDEFILEEEAVPGAAAAMPREVAKVHRIDWIIVGCLGMIGIGIGIDYWSKKKPLLEKKKSKGSF